MWFAGPAFRYASLQRKSGKDRPGRALGASVADRFPEGPLYADLRGFGPAPAVSDPAEVLRAFLEALGVAPARVPAGTDARPAVDRQITAGPDRSVRVHPVAAGTFRLVETLVGAGHRLRQRGGSGDLGEPHTDGHGQTRDNRFPWVRRDARP
jgi:hypothetical protein